jgi:putative component of membrane protein insertase Oxa1/YidC/SpoIIIJ protein YidD
LSGWRLLRCNPWSHGGVDYARDQTVFPLGRSRKARV